MVSFERSLLPVILPRAGDGRSTIFAHHGGNFWWIESCGQFIHRSSAHQYWTEVVLSFRLVHCRNHSLPPLTMNAPWMAVAANVALGLSQGITCSTTVIMKIDIVGKRLRGTAMGLNSGLSAVGGASALAASFMDTNGDFRYIDCQRRRGSSGTRHCLNLLTGYAPLGL